jgi:thymidylate synthase
MSEVVGFSFDSVFAQIVRKINTNPHFICSPRGQKIKENIAQTVVLANPRARLIANPAREVQYGFGVGEFLWYWTGKNDLETMLYYNKRMKDFSDDGKTLNSAYGKRIRVWVYPADKIGPNGTDITTTETQWEACKKTLLSDPDSRRALLLINQPRDEISAAIHGSKDVPCTLSLQFFIRDNQLHLHSHMRSNDAFWGLTYDLFSFTLFQECMLLELQAAGMKDLELGQYFHTAGSLHIYERHFEMADSVVKSYFNNGFQVAAPMEPITLEGLALLVDQEEALRNGRLAQIDEARFDGGVRWMAGQLNQHRRKRDVERSRQVG